MAKPTVPTATPADADGNAYRCRNNSRKQGSCGASSSTRTQAAQVSTHTQSTCTAEVAHATRRNLCCTQNQRAGQCKASESTRSPGPAGSWLLLTAIPTSISLQHCVQELLHLDSVIAWRPPPLLWNLHFAPRNPAVLLCPCDCPSGVQRQHAACRPAARQHLTETQRHPVDLEPLQGVCTRA